MKLAALAILSLVTLAACETRQGEESARGVDAADTIVTSERDIDTTIVTQDTTIEVETDTVRRDDDDPARRDTLQESNRIPDTRPDTGMDTLRQ